MIGNWLLRWLPVKLWKDVITATKRNSRIPDEMHETARGLHSAGLISKRRMGEFEALCNLDVHEIHPQQIKALRKQSNVTQAVFPPC